MRRLNVASSVVSAIMIITAGQTQAELAVYKFSGVVPNDVTRYGNMVNNVSPGETWTVLLTVDLTAQDTVSSSDEGVYLNAGVSVNLSFSGGFSPNLDRSWNYENQVYVANDHSNSAGTLTMDGIQFGLGDVQGGTTVSAFVGTEGLYSLSSDALPRYPTTFVHDMPMRTAFNLLYNSPDDGMIRYTSLDNATFEVVVPEPATMTLWSLTIASLGFGWWRTRKSTTPRTAR